jgi:hypothetical protein
MRLIKEYRRERSHARRKLLVMVPAPKLETVVVVAAVQQERVQPFRLTRQTHSRASR